MITVGITGSFASGKSFVLNYLAKAGYKTFSADEVVRSLYQDLQVQQQILSLFPSLIAFDKARLAELIYEDEAARRILQNKVHPYVLAQLELFKTQNEKEEFIFAEVPLLFESNYEKYFDFIIVTFCSEKNRLGRAESKPGFDLKIYRQLGKIQLPQNEKMLRAHFTINTDGNLVELEAEIAKLMEKLKCQQLEK